MDKPTIRLLALDGWTPLQILREATSAGMEYPDAEERVATTLYLTANKRKRMADEYVMLDDAQHQLSNYWN